MYFPNAFKKAFLVGSNGIANGAVSLASAGTTADLTAGTLGAFNASTYAALSAAGTAPFILAQGSYFTSDKIGPVHGGYKESVKSKTINPKYISRVIKVASKTAQNQVVEVSISNVSEDNTYRLRLDLKGSPALRFLSHNLYKTLDAFTGCAADAAAPALVDPTKVAILWAKQVNESPYLGKFISVAVKDTADAAVAASAYDTFVPAGAITSASTATLVITVAYVESKFGDATFTPTDTYDLEPLQIYTSFVDDSGEPCAVNGITSAEVQAPRQASGVGESVIREMILDGRYRQEAYPDGGHVDSLRMREIEANPGLATINRNGLYDKVLVLHNVPRFNNPSSTFDNDQYLIVINVPAGTTTTAITDFIVGSAVAAGQAIALEVY
jgi:hypothetical protein